MKKDMANSAAVDRSPCKKSSKKGSNFKKTTPEDALLFESMAEGKFFVGKF